MEIKVEDDPLAITTFPARRSERKRVRNPLFPFPVVLTKSPKNSHHMDEGSLRKSKCVICFTSFDHSTSFSKRNKLSPAFCNRVFASFSRFLNFSRFYPNEGISLDFEAFPLPFCSPCTSSVLGWTKLQEQLEELQVKLKNLRNSVMDRIAESVVERVIPDQDSGDELDTECQNTQVLQYDDSIKYLRELILNDINSRIISASTTTGGFEVVETISSSISEPQESKASVQDKFLARNEDTDTEEMEEERREKFENCDSDYDLPPLDSDESCPSEQSEEEEAVPVKVVKKKQVIQKKTANKAKKTETSPKKRFPKMTTSADGRKFYGESELIEIKDEECTKYKCGTCDSVQKTLLTFKRHVQHIHNKGDPFECSLCGKILHNLGSKSRHMKIYHSSVPRALLQCDICGKKVTSQRGMTIHRGLIHREGLDKFHTCDICSRPFHNEREMRTHRWTHMNDEEKMIAMNETKDLTTIPVSHVCAQCGKVLSSEANLRSHELIHSSEKPYVCEVCGWAFRHKANLNKHLEIHMEGDEGFKFYCKEPGCGKKYRSRTQLRNHSFSHKSASAKPHKCPHCDAFFVRAMDLTVHKRIHTGEKPYQCPTCGKYFSRQHHWTRHMRNVHQIAHPGRPTTSQPETETIVTYIDDFNYSLLTNESQKPAGSTFPTLNIIVSTPDMKC